MWRRSDSANARRILLSCGRHHHLSFGEALDRQSRRITWKPSRQRGVGGCMWFVGRDASARLPLLAHVSTRLS